MTTTRIAVHGAGGRMGSGICRLVHESADLELVAAIVRNQTGEHPWSSSETTDLEAIAEADVVIDFSLPQGALLVAQACVVHRKSLLCGTTGLSNTEEQTVLGVGAEAAVLLASNTSLGVNILNAAVARIAESIDWDAEIFEIHHRNKIDAPSGTAKTLARTLSEARGGHPIVGARDGVGKREPDEISVCAARGGTVAGEHTVFFFGENERLELTHRAQSRDIFVRGAVFAARWLAQNPPGIYTMRDALGL